jgi:hypothetical protein
MTRCDYKTGMFAAEEPEWVFDGPVMRVRGDLIGICVHEAGHAVMRFLLGDRSGSVWVKTHYLNGPGVVVAMNSGRSNAFFPPGEIEKPRKPKDIAVFIDPIVFMCWAPMLRNAMITCAGHASQMKYCRANGVPFAAGSDSDRQNCEYESRRCWMRAGRNGHAMLRHAWAQTQRLLEIPAVWRAVQEVEASLFSGLLWKEPADPRPGGQVEFAIEGAEVEALIEGTGLRFGAHWQEHRCSPECVRSRPISKRFRAVVEEWASENSSSLNPENIKETCDAC